MTLTLHALGDVTFLAAILNGIAMLFNGEDLRMAAALGALVGVLLMALRALLSLDGRAPRVQEFLAALLLWMLLFEPKVTVEVEEIYHGETQVVSQVPLGPAVSGALISAVGLGLTQLFETAFSTPAMTRTGFAGSLEVLAHLRRQIRIALDNGTLTARDPTFDIKTSLEHYIADCTLTGVDLGRIPIETLLKSQPLPLSLRYDSDIYTTALLDGQQPEGVTCRAAWPRIERLFDDARTPALAAASRALNAQGGPDAAMERIQEALDALSDSQRSAGDYVLEAVLVPLFERGLRARQLEGGEAGRLALIEGAIQQRNTQWAAEQTLFARLVRPVLTWIEGFSYAITPLMAFTVLLGTPGIRMCGQYVLMLLWIQCWMPILAIANLYITLAAEGSLSALARSETVTGSISAHYALNQEIQNWLAVGGMLASATPAIALMLVYGGSVTATHFLGRLQGGDVIDEKILTPSLAGNAPLLTHDTRARHSPLKGLAVEGADGVLPSFSLDQGQGIEQRQGHRQAEHATESWSLDRRQTLSGSLGVQSEGRIGHAASAQDATSQTETDQFIAATGEAFSRRYRTAGVSSDEVATLIGSALQGQFGGGGGKGGSAMAAGLSLALQERYQVGHQQADEMASDLSRQITEQQAISAARTHAVSQSDEAVSARHAVFAQRSDATGATAHAKMQGAMDEDSASADARHHLGVRSTLTVGAREVGIRFASERPLGEALDRALESVGLTGDAERLGQEWHHRGLIRDPVAARDAAGVALLTGHTPPVYHPLDGEEAVLARTLGRTLLGDAFRGPYNPAPERPEREWSDRGIDAEGLKAQVIAPLRGLALPEAEALDAAASQLRAEALHRVENQEDLARALEKTGNTRREALEDQERSRLALESTESLGRVLKEDQPSGLAESLKEQLTQGLKGIDQHLEPVVATAKEALTALFESEDPARDAKALRGKSLDERLSVHRERVVEERLTALGDALTPVERTYLAELLRERLGLEPDPGPKTAALRALNAEAGALADPIARALQRLSYGTDPSLAGRLRSLRTGRLGNDGPS